MILGAYYLLWMLQRVIFGPLREPHGTTTAGGHDARRTARPARSAGTRSPG